MKYLILVGDGMADEPIDELGGLTPLEKASTPHMDYLARSGLTGLAETVPAAFIPAPMSPTCRSSAMTRQPVTPGVRRSKPPAWGWNSAPPMSLSGLISSP